MAVKLSKNQTKACQTHLSHNIGHICNQNRNGTELCRQKVLLLQNFCHGAGDRSSWEITLIHGGCVALLHSCTSVKCFWPSMSCRNTDFLATSLFKTWVWQQLNNAQQDCGEPARNIMLHCYRDKHKVCFLLAAFRKETLCQDRQELCDQHNDSVPVEDEHCPPNASFVTGTQSVPFAVLHHLQKDSLARKICLGIDRATIHTCLTVSI